MTGLMRKRGLAIPQFKDRTTTFTVTLDRHGLLDPSTRHWLTAVGADGLPPHARCALAMVLRDELVDDQVLRHQIGIDTRDAQHLLARLVAEGWLTYPRHRGGSLSAGSRLAAAAAQPSLLDLGEERPPRPGRSASDAAIVGALDPTVPRNVHEIVDLTGLSLPYVRVRLRVLVDLGQIRATAGPTSRRRGYLRATPI